MDLLGYPGRVDHRCVQPTALLVIHTSIAFSVPVMLCAGILVVAGLTAAHPLAWFTWNNFLLFLSYVKLLISCLKYIPQVFLNDRRKSTVGW